MDYFHGGEKPYLISGADDRLVKIWDYQVNICFLLILLGCFTITFYMHNCILASKCLNLHTILYSLPLVQTRGMYLTIKISFICMT